MNAEIEVYNRCACDYCKRNKNKLVMYERCSKCLQTSYLIRIKRIEMCSDVKTVTCGFLCENCNTILAMAESVIEIHKSMQAFYKCSCPNCMENKKPRKGYPQCRNCCSTRELDFFKRTDTYIQNQEVVFGYKCLDCSVKYIHSVSGGEARLSSL